MFSLNIAQLSFLANGNALVLNDNLGKKYIVSPIQKGENIYFQIRLQFQPLSAIVTDFWNSTKNKAKAEIEQKKIRPSFEEDLITALALPSKCQLPIPQVQNTNYTFSLTNTINLMFTNLKDNNLTTTFSDDLIAAHQHDLKKMKKTSNKKIIKKKASEIQKSLLNNFNSIIPNYFNYNPEENAVECNFRMLKSQLENLYQLEDTKIESQLKI